jgi:hypothetical protein
MAKTTTNSIDGREANCELYTAELQDRGLLEQMEDEREYAQYLYPNLYRRGRGYLEQFREQLSKFNTPNVVEEEDDF